MKKGMEVRLNVLPIYANIIHTGSWEGPCRVGKPDVLDPKYEIENGKLLKDQYERKVKSISNNHINILDCLYIEYSESFIVSEETFSEIKKRVDNDNVDLFVISYRVPGIERFNIPVSMIDKTPVVIDLVAFLRSENHEAYIANDLKDFSDVCHLLWVRKCIQNTKLLLLKSDFDFPVSVNTSNDHPEILKELYGLDFISMHFKEVFNVMDTINDNDKINDLYNKLSSNALKNILKEEWLKQDIKFYLAVNKMLEDNSCNAFTIPCKELCASRIPARYHITPCLTHTLNKDNMIPSACEQDLNVFMAIMIFMYISDKSVFMGNPQLVLKDEKIVEDLGMSEVVYGPNSFDKEMLEIRHSVPGLKMNGFNEPDLKYSLGAFTVEGWGTKVQINLGDNKEQRVTIGRFDRSGKKMIVETGTIKGCAFRNIECSPSIYIDLDSDVREYRETLANLEFGHHQAVVYGDYKKEIIKLGKIMGFEVITLNHK